MRRLWPIVIAIIGIFAVTRLKCRVHRSRPPDPDRQATGPGDWTWDAW